MSPTPDVFARVAAARLANQEAREAARRADDRSAETFESLMDAEKALADHVQAQVDRAKPEAATVTRLSGKGAS